MSLTVKDENEAEGDLNEIMQLLEGLKNDNISESEAALEFM